MMCQKNVRQDDKTCPVLESTRMSLNKKSSLIELCKDIDFYK